MKPKRPSRLAPGVRDAVRKAYLRWREVVERRAAKDFKNFRDTKGRPM